MDNKPYEVFTCELSKIELPNNVETGTITKLKGENGKNYVFEYEGGEVVGLGKVNNKDLWNYGKLISGILRHGMPLPFVVDTIQGLTWEEEHINTWKNGIARALKKFIKDGKAIGFTCKECGSDQVIFEEGCSRCLSCGSSKCG